MRILFLLDAGCICHLADLTIRARLKTLPADIDQLFIDQLFIDILISSITSNTAVREDSTSLISGV